MISERAKEQFIIGLKFFGIKYEDIHGKGDKNHYRDSTDLITGDDMRTMCSDNFGHDYEVLTPPEQRKFRVSIFESFKVVD